MQHRTIPLGTEYYAVENLPFNKVNYLAIVFLEKLGLPEPSQTQIDMIEMLILLSSPADKLEEQLFYAGNGIEQLAKKIFLEQFKEANH